ncbi:hypothetical protein HU200_052356 [Digitaria exilis]|uniref:Peptidase S9 prolyl oligopeptidase catalytic domain-containing protein n=1 Tax=Digitaria exilis TaxID=1010633 RepID=A0A835E9I7_9POAL|nr:hypothetical protein HU200_052356 [Digitaria exilis]
MAPYGSWASPISAAAASVAGRTVEGLAVAGDGRLVWVEKRPEQGGASVLVREAAEPGGGAVDMTPEGFAVRTLAQEYGGGSGAFAVQGDTVVFSNYSDQRLYKQTIGGGTSPLPVTPDYAGSTVRYADGVFDPHFCRYVTIMEGGPTDEARGILDLNVQYWTSRGWALVDVNYGGSSGSHKFEAYYTDNLVGNKQAYFERSPINFVDKFTCPLILFHGLKDTVVSPEQTTKIYKAIKEKGLPVALVEFEGEAHGFRMLILLGVDLLEQAENIKFTMEQEMVFFARLVGKFNVADDITPIKIENFD